MKPAHDNFYVEGEFFSWGKKRTLPTGPAGETAFIQQEGVQHDASLLCVHRRRGAIPEIVKRFTFFFEKYEIKGLDWTIEGDFWAHEYRITQNGREVVSISELVHIGQHCYALDIADSAG